MFKIHSYESTVKFNGSATTLRVDVSAKHHPITAEPDSVGGRPLNRLQYRYNKHATEKRRPTRPLGQAEKRWRFSATRKRRRRPPSQSVAWRSHDYLCFNRRFRHIAVVQPYCICKHWNRLTEVANFTTKITWTTIRMGSAPSMEILTRFIYTFLSFAEFEGFALQGETLDRFSRNLTGWPKKVSNCQFFKKSY